MTPVSVVGVSGGAAHGPVVEPVAGGREQLAAAGVDGTAIQDGLGAALDAVGTEGTVLASGDPGFFGVLRAVRARVGDDVVVHPAPSSVALAFARVGVPWDDALVVSGHGRAPHTALAVALRHDKVAVLTSPEHGPEHYLPLLKDRRTVVCCRLGEADEVVRTEGPFPHPNVLLVLPDDDDAAGRVTVWPPRGPAVWGLPEDAFEHRAGLITKREVRALALARLGPGVGDLVWDVGCGSGSVGVECARLGAAVVAIDRDPGLIGMTAQNAASHGVRLRGVCGEAPDVLADLPDPDAVFVGGGGVALPAILDAVCARVRRAVVVTLALVDRVAPTIEQLAAAGLEVDAVQLQASRMAPIAGGHRLAAENPVTLITASRC